jgi:hypothetical protein
MTQERKDEVHRSEQIHAGAQAFHCGYVSALGKRNDQRTDVNQSRIDEAANDDTRECGQNVSCDRFHVLDSIVSM